MAKSTGNIRKWLWMQRSYVFGVVIGLAFSPAIIWPHQIARWLEQHDKLSGWAEATGSMLAIAVAIYFSRSDSLERKESSLRRGRALAQSLTGSIWLLDMELTRVERTISRYKDHGPPDDDWDLWFQASSVDIPRSLVEAMPLMQTAEDEYVGLFRAATMLAATFNSYLKKFSTLDPDKARENWAKLFAQIAGQIALLRKTVTSITTAQLADKK